MTKKMIVLLLVAVATSLTLLLLILYTIKLPDKNRAVEKTPQITIMPSILPQLASKKPTPVTTNPLTINPTPTNKPVPSPSKVIMTLTPTIPPKAVIIIMPLGDSITDGVFYPGGYLTYLYNMLQQNGYKVDFVGSMVTGNTEFSDWNHEGHIGWEVSQLGASSGGWVATYQPDIVLIHVGTNDLDHGTSAEVITGRLSTMLANIFAAKPDTYVIVSTIIERN